MVRIGASPPAAAATAPVLPKVSFTKVEDDAFSGFSGVPDGQARSYGYNDGSSFKLPEHYIRYIEPLESELAVQVEYDMDEQDQEWLDSVNADRRAASMDKVSYETFEVVMDRLEKEWFDLTKNLPKPDLAMPSEDSTCAICDDSEGENTNAIVFCDGCNLAVHQDCYGVPYIPEGQWLCRKCTVSPENPVSCILCPNEGGAFKQTVHGEWVHLLCAIWVPETRVANDVFMEPVTGVDRIPKQRWKLKCSICDIRTGACIQCIKASCFSAFHATCARKEKLLMPMKASQGSEAPTLACYCEKHLPREQAEARLTALQSEQPSPTTDAADASQTSKTARAYAKTYKPGPPLVPRIIVDRIMQYIGKVTVRQKREFVVLVCKYWSLKREARRGAPLLKRLHLEPWTANAGGRQSDEDKAAKLKLLKGLREDLERLRTLSDTVRKREIQKLRQQNIIQQILQRILYPFHPVMRNVFESIKSGDKQDYFLVPVSKTEVPDYYDIIKEPMSWSVIDQKLTDHAYMDLQDFKDDILLVLNNAMTYNKPDTPFYRTAQRIKKSTERAFPELDQFITQHLQVPLSDSAEGTSDLQLPSVGDLEPSLRMLDLLINAEHIRPDLKFVIDKEPLEALFSYEFAEHKPPPTPPLPSPAPAPESEPAPETPVVPSKPKRNRRAERERARERRISALAAMDVHLPRTRGARAAAGLPVEDPDEPSTSPTTDAHIHGASTSGMNTEHALMDVDGEPPAKRRRSAWRRAPIVLPGQTDVPPVVDAVDDQTSFSMFDGGWILPEGQKRHKRLGAPVSERSERKGGKSAEPNHQPIEVESEEEAEVDEQQEPEARPSELDVAPPSPSPSPVSAKEYVEEEAAETSPAPAEEPVEEDHIHDEPMDVDAEPTSQLTEELPDTVSVVEEVEHTGDTTEEEPEPDQDPDAEGEPEEVQVEQVLGHVTEDETSMSEDHPAPTTAGEVAIVPATSETTEDVPMAEPEAPPSEAPKSPADGAGDDADQQSDLTALSDSESTKSPARQTGEETPSQDAISSGDLTEISTRNETPEGPQSSVDEDHSAAQPGPSTSKKSSKRKSTGGSKRKGKAKEILNPEAGRINWERGKPLLEAGTLVWAKIPSYPWWPGVIYDFEDELIPPTVIRKKTRKQLENDGLHIVQFFDDQNYWSLVPAHCILMLGENEELDDDMTAWKSTRQKWKSQKVFRGCEKAFLRAREEMDG